MAIAAPANWMNFTVKAPRIITVESPSYTVATPDGESITLKPGDSVTINVAAPPKSAAQIAYEAHLDHHAHRRNSGPFGGILGPIFPWEALTPATRSGWVAVAEALRDHFEDSF